MKDNKGRFAKGNPGRPKGAKNKAAQEIREAFEKLLTNNLSNMEIWLSDVAAENPEKALEFMARFAEYSLPKLARQEVSHELPDTKEFTVNIKK